MTAILDMLDIIPNTEETESNVDAKMKNPEYLRQSADIINKALKDGYDVLQLENGDIVATGIKTIVNHYKWDELKSDLVKSRTKERKKA